MSAFDSCTLRELALMESMPIDFIEHVQRGDISPAMRQGVLSMLEEVARCFNLSSQVYFLAVTTLDRFLSVIKIKPRHLQIIALTSLWIAENEISGRPLPLFEILAHLGENFTPHDVERMETIIRSKLQHKILVPTWLDCLRRVWKTPDFANMACLKSRQGLTVIPEDHEIDVSPLNDQTILRNAKATLIKAVKDYNLCVQRPSVLAISILLLKVEDRFGISEEFSTSLQRLTLMTNSSIGEVKECMWRLAGLGFRYQ